MVHHVCTLLLALQTFFLFPLYNSFGNPRSTHQALTLIQSFLITDAFPAADTERDVENGKATTTGVQGPLDNTTGNMYNVPRRNVEKEIQRMLLLNAYPILYIILWAPGLINRLVEASGHKSHLLTVLQCSTQFIGLANAITYGFNEHLRKAIKDAWATHFKRGA
jgi:hypothetical protein